MNIQQKIDLMLEKSHWLWSNQYDFVVSIAKQLKTGKSLSEKQVNVINNIYCSFNKNQRVRFVNGGSPGLRKR